MKIKLINIGDTDLSFLREGIDYYLKKITHYVPTEIINLPGIKASKTSGTEQLKKLEGNMIIKHITPADVSVLLDERGKQYSSAGFSAYLQQWMNRGVKNLTFITGGAYGFSQEVYDRVKEHVSLSAMTFTHQLVRLVFLEQLYRAFTILKGEPYHHI
jgi:23S rRNA (pseudouridine1915-N3)-methyltransferase